MFSCMQTKVKIVKDSRIKGSWKRSGYRQDTIYTFWLYREYKLVNVRGEWMAQDSCTEELLAAGKITAQERDAYYSELIRMIADSDTTDDMGTEAIYACFRRIYRKHFGDERPVTEKEPVVSGMNQRDLFMRRLQSMRSVILVLDETAEKPMHDRILQLLRDIRVYTVRMDEEGFDPEMIPYDTALQEDIDENRCLLLVCGEGGFTGCRDLCIDSFVCAEANSYGTSALVNGRKGKHLLYVPAGTDLTKYVRLYEPSELTFSQLYELQKEYGEGIYGMSLQELRRTYPDDLVNIYEDLGRRIALPAAAGDTWEQYKQARLQAYFNQFPDVTYRRVCFNGSFAEVSAESAAEDHMIVHTVCLPQGSSTEIIQGDGTSSLRQIMRSQDGDWVLSNFLFFMTPKLLMLYNQQRHDRPEEQLGNERGHLDYMKTADTESFPLYRKACFGIREDGSYVFMHPEIRHGHVNVSGAEFVFDDTCVNTYDDERDLIIYTPYLSMGEEGGSEYTKEVGHGRVNIVLVQDKVIAVRHGSVLLPCIGTVLSFREGVLDMPVGDENGYCYTGFKVRIHLDDPLLSSVRTAYGGGMMLIHEGREFTMQDLEREGWMCPLSVQTQDSAVEKPVRHPRTALGQRADGSLIIMVIDGRYPGSRGANYKEMCTAARKLYPDIRELMNVDGGASALLGISVNGIFMELNRPATSASNPAGMARAVNTALAVRIR